MKHLNHYKFQFNYYAVGYGAHLTNLLCFVEGFDRKEEAEEYINDENKRILEEEYDGNEDKWENAPDAVEWMLFDSLDLFDLGTDSPYFETAVDVDAVAGRHCVYELSKYIKLFYGTQKAFACAQGVQPAQATQWLKKNCFVIYDDGRWILSIERRELI